MENQPPVQPIEPEKAKKIKKEKPKRTVKQEIMSWVWTLLAAVVIASIIRAFIFEPILVDGSSMNNTLLNNEIVYCSKLDYLIGSPQRGDVIICRYPDRESTVFDFGAALSFKSYTLFVKRLVALPGDTVAVSEGKLYVNDKLVEDPELMGSFPRDSYPRTTLKADEYFVMGDNRGNSHDSRASDVGPLSRDQIMGQVKYVLFPFDKIRAVH